MLVIVGLMDLQAFPGGNDQESTSESMQFASSLIHWGNYHRK